MNESISKIKGGAKSKVKEVEGSVVHIYSQGLEVGQNNVSFQ